jgi:hypothetical protein
MKSQHLFLSALILFLSLLTSSCQGDGNPVVPHDGSGFNPVDVTPPLLNVVMMDLAVQGNYLYIAGGADGLFIFDVSNPSVPIKVSQTVTSGGAMAIAVVGHYAYVGCQDSTLQIIDVGRPSSPRIVKTVEVQGSYAWPPIYQSGARNAGTTPTPGYFSDLAVSGGYAYLAEGSEGLQVIDIDPPELAHTVQRYTDSGYTENVAVDDGFVCTFGIGYGDDPDYLDVTREGSSAFPQPENKIELPGTPWGKMDIEGGYAYVSVNNYHENASQLLIIDIDPVESMHIARILETPRWSGDVEVADGLAFIADSSPDLYVVNVEDPEKAFFANTIEVGSHVSSLAVAGGYAYAALGEEGLRIIDVDPCWASQTVYESAMCGDVWDVAIEGGYAYVPHGYYIDVIDIDPPESAHVSTRIHQPEHVIDMGQHELGYMLDHIPAPPCITDFAVDSGYAYLTEPWFGLDIMRVDPPEDAYLVKSIESGGMPEHVAVSNGNAYVSDFNEFQIFDIDPVESASQVKTIYSPLRLGQIEVQNGYAYVQGNIFPEPGCDTFGIVDIDPYESATYLKTVKPGYVLDLDISGDYLYIAGSVNGLQIYDINPPESAHLEKTVPIPLAYGVSVFDGYVCVAEGEEGISIVDVDPIETAHVVRTFDLPGRATKVSVVGRYAYVACQEAGLRIVRLW